MSVQKTTINDTKFKLNIKEVEDDISLFLNKLIELATEIGELNIVGKPDYKDLVCKNIEEYAVIKAYRERNHEQIVSKTQQIHDMMYKTINKKKGFFNH